MTTVADVTCEVCGLDSGHHDTTSHRLAPELARLRRIEAASRDLLTYYDNLPKYGVDQWPDLGVRVARLNAALSEPT